MRQLTLVVLLLVSYACASTPKSTLLYYRVKVREGESVAEIAQRFDTTWKKILRDNNLATADQITPGLILRVKPGPGGYLAGTQKMKRQTSSRGLLFGGDKSAANTFIWPLHGRVTSEFGYRWLRKHEGIDIDGHTGDRIVAAANGKVTFAGWQRGYGNVVMIDHGNLHTRYAHLHKIKVRLNQAVSQGEYIGQVGATGNASGSHLHFEIRNDQKNTIDPRQYLPEEAMLSAR